MRKALHAGGDTHTIEDLVEALKRGEMQIFHNDRAVIVTEVVQAPRRRYLHLFLVAGDMDAVDALGPQVTAFARDQGCEFARAQVRPGFEPALRSRGWRKTQLITELKFPWADPAAAPAR